MCLVVCYLSWGPYGDYIWMWWGVASSEMSPPAVIRRVLVCGVALWEWGGTQS